MSGAFDVERVLRLTDDELANLRGQLCPVNGCGEHDCESVCDRCGDHHGSLTQIKPGRFRIVCAKCSVETECACGCGAVRPRYLMVKTDIHDGGGELFTEQCAGRDAMVSW